MEYPDLMKLNAEQKDQFRALVEGAKPPGRKAPGNKAIVWVHPFHTALDEQYGGERYDRIMTGLLKKSQKSGRPVIILEKEGHVGDTLAELNKRGFTPENTPLYFVETWPTRPEPNEGGWDAFHRIITEAGVKSVSVGGQRLLFDDKLPHGSGEGFLRDVHLSRRRSLERLDESVEKGLRAAAKKPVGKRDELAMRILSRAKEKEQEIENRVPIKCVGNTLHALRARGVRATYMPHGVLPQARPKAR